MSVAVEYRPFRDADREAGYVQASRAFLARLQPWDEVKDLPTTPLEDSVGAFAADGSLLAQAWWWRVDQFFGERPVPIAAIARVTVAATARRRGVGSEVMTRALRNAREQGAAMATLYATLPGFYRRHGFEVAGLHTDRTISTEMLATIDRDVEGVTVHQVEVGAEGVRSRVADMYADLAPRQAGHLGHGGSRDAWLWSTHARGRHDVFIAVDDAGQDGGYLIVHREDVTAHDPVNFYTLEVQDVQARDEQALRALWGVVAGFAPLLRDVGYVTGAVDPLTLLVGRRGTVTAAGAVDRWMSRVLDPVAAVDARGFGVGIDLTIPLTIVDETPLGGSGMHGVLEVSAGQGRLTPSGPDADAVLLDIGAFSSMFTGHASASMLASLGRATGDRETIAALDTAFAGPSPWMIDFF